MNLPRPVQLHIRSILATVNASAFLELNVASAKGTVRFILLGKEGIQRRRVPGPCFRYAVRALRTVPPLICWS